MLRQTVALDAVEDSVVLLTVATGAGGPGEPDRTCVCVGRSRTSHLIADQRQWRFPFLTGRCPCTSACRDGGLMGSARGAAIDPYGLANKPNRRDSTRFR